MNNNSQNTKLVSVMIKLQTQSSDSNHTIYLHTLPVDLLEPSTRSVALGTGILIIRSFF